MNLFNRKEKKNNEIIPVPVPSNFAQYCPHCGTATIVRYSRIGAYFVECGKDKWHYEHWWKDATPRYDTNTGEKLNV